MNQSSLPQQSSTLRSHDEVQQNVNELLGNFFNQQITNAKAVGASYEELWQLTADFLLSGGKRIRPYLTIMAYEGSGGKDYERALSAAVAQELLHGSLLFIDDIIDRDSTRYGRDTVAEMFRKKYSLLTTSSDEASHFGNSAGMLAGSLLLSSAQSMLAEAVSSTQNRAEILAVFERGIFEVAGGEFLDTESSLIAFDEVDCLKILRYKTASYSFIAPLKIGALLAGASKKTVQALESIGERVGIAYQLVDDILGIFGEENITGKSVSSDIQEGKRTYLMQETLKRANEQDLRLLQSVIGAEKVTHAELEAVKVIIINTGTKATVEQMVADYQEQALDLLKDSGLGINTQTALSILISKALKRSY